MGEVLIIGPLTAHTGNSTTAERIRCHVEAGGSKCVSRHVDSFSEPAEFERYVRAQRVYCVLGIHAFKSARLLNVCPVPYAIILSGTDVNGFSTPTVDPGTMAQIIDRARILIAFTHSMLSKATVLWPKVNEKKLWCIPQAICTTLPRPDLRPRWREESGLGADALVLLLVAGLRLVKDPLYLLHAFSEWHQRVNNRVYLIIIGPRLDLEYSSKCLDIVRRLAGVFYGGELSLAESHAAIADSFALVNSSLSEGMSTAILEAMDLGVPVVARRVVGNVDIIEDGRTGFLYSQPQEFLCTVERLLADPSLRRAVVEAARTTLHQRHGCATERAAYTQLLATLHPMTSSKPHSRTSSKPHTMTSSKLHSMTSSKPLSMTSSKLHSMTSSKHHSMTSSKQRSESAPTPYAFTAASRRMSVGDGRELCI